MILAWHINRDFSLAQAEFGKVLAIDSNDKAAMLHMRRCQHWIESPPSDADWDEGVWTFKEK